MFFRLRLYLATAQPSEKVRHPAIENLFAMGRTPAATAFSYGLRRKWADLAEQFLYLHYKMTSLSPQVLKKIKITFFFVQKVLQ